MPCPLPARASIRDLLADLLGQPVTIADAGEQQLETARKAQLAAYRLDDGTLAALCVADLELAGSAAAAIGALPAATVGEAVGRGDLGDDLAGHYRETVNVLSRLLNTPTTPHVTLGSLHAVPGEVPADVARLALAPARRADFLVTVEGFGGGALTLAAGADGD